MVKKKTERLIPQSDQPKKQISRGKVTVPKNSKQNALSTEKNSLENRKTAKKPTSGKKNSAGQKKQNPQKANKKQLYFHYNGKYHGTALGLVVHKVRDFVAKAIFNGSPIANSLKHTIGYNAVAKPSRLINKLL